jgi:glucose/arabinose dehydrogenase
MKTFPLRSWPGVIALLAWLGQSAQAQLPTFIQTDAFPGLNFVDPVCITAPPGETNRLFIVEQTGVISVITNLANPTKTVFLDISGRVDYGGELGLLGMAFHPGFESNRWFYVFYTGQATNGGSGLHDILSRFEAWMPPWDPNTADPNTELRLIVQEDDADNHNGGDIHFGSDGYLYVALGDEGGGGDSENNSQRIDKDFFSGMLRIDVDKRPGNLMPNPHPASTDNYFVPADNPFVGATTFNGSSVNPTNVRTEFWAVGLRNPWRWSFDPQTGFAYCGDVGQGAREEIDVITRGGNYGWAFREGNIAGPKSTPGTVTSRVDPIHDYDRSEGNCVIGGVVYRGSRYLELFGYYVFADIGSGNVWALTYDGTNASNPEVLFTQTGISGFGTDPRNGDVLYCNINSDTIRKIGTPAPPGSLQVIIDPPGAIAGGAQWRVDGGSFQNSSNTLSGISAGNHTVSFKSVPGWIAPANKSVTVLSATTTTTNGTYVSNDSAKPTVTVVVPKSGQRVSNEMFSATGTAKDNVLVAAVWHQLNGAAWTTASGTTNWTADLTLVPGNNVLNTYAVDINGNISKTNSVTFLRVLLTPLVVQIEGSGSVNPNYNGQSLEIGKSYTMTAKAAKGFAFSNWSGSIVTNKTKLTFVMTSNLTFTANFVDVQAPLNVITFPPVNKKVTNTLLTVSGKATDNVGVTAVGVQLNGSGWYSADTTNSWTNWFAAGLVPNSGGNLVQAWAADVAGNVSKTNSVKFTYVVGLAADWAPDFLSGLTAAVTPDASSPLNVSFDALTFSQHGASTNDDFSVGIYDYVKTSTNTAQLTLTNTAPSTQTNNSPGLVNLTFTNHYSGIFTNGSGGGIIRFFIETNLAPTTVAGKKIIAAGSHGTHTIMLNKKTSAFTLTPSISGSIPASTGTYTYQRFSPAGAMLVLTFGGPEAGVVTYVQMIFTSAKAGNYLATTLNGSGTPTDVDLNTFTLP